MVEVVEDDAAPVSCGGSHPSLESTVQEEEVVPKVELDNEQNRQQ